MLYLTLRQLQYVVAVAKAGSLSEAAINLNISQPALSVAITQVENHLQQKLFIRRKGAPIRLTAFADPFVREASDLLARAARLENPATAASHKMLRLAIGCFKDIAPFYLAPVLQQLRLHFPELEVYPLVASFNDLATGMKDGSIDLAITYDLGLDANFDKRILKQIAPHAVYGSRFDLGPNPTLQMLADQPLILFDEGLSIRHMLGLFKARGLRPRIAHRVASLEVMRSLAANGEGVGISYSTPPSGVSYDGKPVIQVPIRDPESREPIILARVAGEVLPNPISAVSDRIQMMVCFQGENG
ncbi:MAG: LysR family transcriptional regulator [Rhodobacteraceae bacterium]|nr:LysR family transcriptional regulator [Paracoccaceae bacterium]